MHSGFRIFGASNRLFRSLDAPLSPPVFLSTFIIKRVYFLMSVRKTRPKVTMHWLTGKRNLQKTNALRYWDLSILKVNDILTLFKEIVVLFINRWICLHSRRGLVPLTNGPDSFLALVFVSWKKDSYNVLTDGQCTVETLYNVCNLRTCEFWFKILRK